MSFAIHWLRIGLSLKSRGKFKKAISAYEKAIHFANGEEIIEIYKAIGQAYFLLDDFDNALEHYNFALTASIAMRIAEEQFSVDTDDEKLDILIQHTNILPHIGRALVSASPRMLSNFVLWTLAKTPIFQKGSLDMDTFTTYVINEMTEYNVQFSDGALTYPDDFEFIENPIPEPYSLNQLYRGFTALFLLDDSELNWDLIQSAKQEPSRFLMY